MYWLFVSVSDSIVDADSPKDAWDNLIAFNATTNTRTRKLQLKNELNTIKKGDLSVNDYTLKIKALCESLSSIGVAVDDDDKVEACLRGLGNAYKQFKTSIRTRENIRHFLELSSCWLLRKRASLMMELFKQKEIAPNMPFGQVQEEVEGVMHKEVAVAIKVNANNNSKTNKPSKISMVNKGLCVVEDSSEGNNRGQQNNYVSTSTNNDDAERLLVMQHMSNIVSKSVSTMQDDNVWYVDSGASNHMTGRGEWFKSMHTLQNAGYVQTRDDTAHPIAHIEYKKNGKLVAQGKKVRSMFTLNVNMPKMNAAMFAQGTSVVVDVEIWHKRIGHANVQRLKLMQSKELVTGLPQFRVFEMQQVCAACQLGKQAKGSFPQEIHVRKNLLEVIHSDVWGPAKNTSKG
ncbi:hypothetical protein L7F22_053679 [Adiantum nelumboides]|nr:hypothetical protein [Adiantum nelumboides]